MGEPRVDVVVPVYNAPEDLRSIVRALSLFGEEVRPILVDDGSADPNTKRVLQEAGKEWKVITSTVNRRFTATVNRGLMEVERDVLLCNQDISWSTTDWLWELLEALHREDGIGAVAPLRISGDGIYNLWAEGKGRYRWLRTAVLDVGQVVEKEIDEIDFSCILLKHRALRELGPLDEDFVHYRSDSEYCKRMREAGWKILFYPKFALRHKKHASTNATEASGLAFRDMETWERKFPDPEKPRVNLFGEHAALSGYGNLTCRVWQVLEEGFDVSLLGGGGTMAPPSLSAQGQVWGTHSPVFPGHPTISVTRPDLAIPFSWVYTMLEVEGHVPEHWVRQMNALQGVLVPSEFNKRTFREAGVRVPIKVAHPPFDDYYYNPIWAPHIFPHSERRFNIFTLFEWGPRKCPEAIRWTGEVFRGHGDVAIYAMTRARGFDVARALRAYRVPGGPPVFLFTNYQPEEVLSAYYRGADLFLFVSRGEGWGCPLVEAMACGTPPITTCLSGHSEYVTEENAFVVPCGLTTPQDICPYYQGETALWGDPSEVAFKEIIREVYEDWKKGGKVLAEKAEKGLETASRFTLQAQRPLWKRLIEEIGR